jgi:hypothetical protein
LDSSNSFLFWSPLPKSGYYGGVLGDQLSTLSTATVYKPLVAIY